MIKKFTWLYFFCLLASCQKYELTLRQIPVTGDYLASSHVKTPDPRQACPPHGQKIVLRWTVPPELLTKNPQILFHMIYKNHTEKTIAYPIYHRTGTEVYDLLDKDFDETEGLLTYRADIVTEDCKIFRSWKHQLWVNLINLEEEKL